MLVITNRSGWLLELLTELTKNDRGLIFLAKLASFMCFSTLLLRLTLKNKYFELQISDYEIVKKSDKMGKNPKFGPTENG